MRDSAGLSKLLTIDAETDDVYGVLGRMNLLTELSKREEKFNHLLPFLTVYRHVTQEVILLNSSKRSGFHDTKSLAELDVYFAKLYFDPLRKFLLTGKPQTPWAGYYKFCSEGVDSPLLQMLLGINAHINGDLTTALVATGYNNRHDFELINRILRKLIPTILGYLIREEHDPLAATAFVARGTTNSLVEKTVIAWREEAWRNAESIRTSIGKLPKTQRPKVISRQISRIHVQTEALALELMKPRTLLNY